MRLHSPGLKYNRIFAHVAATCAYEFFGWYVVEMVDEELDQLEELLLDLVVLAANPLRCLAQRVLVLNTNYV